MFFVIFVKSFGNFRKILEILLQIPFLMLKLVCYP